MTIIYGVNTEKHISPSDVRDAIVECFTQAHKEQLDELKEYSHNNISDKEFEEMKRINVRQLVRNMMKNSGGDYDRPTKETIKKAIEKLKEFAGNFRNQEIIEKHYKDILVLIEKLKE